MQALLQVKNLSASFTTPSGSLDVVKDISFSVRRGEAVGIVGESGSGKTMTGLSILDLVPGPAGRISSGQILWEDRDILDMSSKEKRRLRGDRISMIFQDPMASLSPFYTVGDQISEVISTHRALSRSELAQHTLELLRVVGIKDVERRCRQYPHEFSGGMRQRIMIAMALANNPDLLIADEPTTALDVTIQAQILELLAARMRARKGQMSLLLISHNWGVISALCDRVIVMYAGRIVEEGPAAQVYAQAKHPYTQALLRSVPKWGTPSPDRLPTIKGQAPRYSRSGPGCSFADRCEQFLEVCRHHNPSERMIHDHRYSCIHD